MFSLLLKDLISDFILDDKWATYGLERRLFVRYTYCGSTHMLSICKRFFEKNSTVPKPLSLDKDEL